MAQIVADDIQESTTTSGTGPLTLLGATAQSRTFASVMAVGDTCRIRIESSNGVDWENSQATLQAGGFLLRTFNTGSTSSTGNLVNFGSERKTVSLVLGTPTVVTYTLLGALLIYLATGALGYTTGTGSTVTQATNKTTGVTLNNPTGQITLNAASLAAGATASFTLTNNLIAATDTLVLGYKGGTSGGYKLNFEAGAGSATISVTNTTGGALAEALVLNFALIKGSSN